MLRKFKLFTIVIVILLLMIGCDLDKKIGESITEKILEEAGDDVDLDIDNGDISFTSEEGEEVTFDEEDGIIIEGEDGSVVSSGGVYDWPKDQAAEFLPKFEGGKIGYILNSKETCLLMIEETNMEDYEDYLKDVIDEGYTKDKIESKAEDMVLYSASSEVGNVVTISFVKSEGVLTISLDTTNSSN